MNSAGGGPKPGRVGPNEGAGHQPIVLSGNPPDDQAEQARGQHEGPVGVGQGGTHGLHRPPVGRRRRREVSPEGHLVLEGQMDHPVRVGRRLGQAFGVVEVSPLNRGAGRFQPLGRSVRARQADHFVTGSQQLGHDGRADPT